MNVAIIPARMASTRFPGKPLALIHGKPMIYHVYKRTCMAKTVDEVYIATCDEVIEEYCKENHMNVVMTSTEHERACDRAGEAMISVERKQGKKIDILVMVQGDEPMLYPDMVDSAINALRNEVHCHVVNLMGKLKNQQEHEDPNEVKVVVDKDDYALYFSREPIPSRKKGGTDIPMLKQVCVIPFRRDFLISFNKLPQTPLEVIESVDMLRVLENGHLVKMVICEFDTYSVDTPGDLAHVETLMKDDPLTNEYEI